MPKRPLLLSGIMATGKSTVGRLLADMTGAAFFDLDSEIETRSGSAISEIFERSGEAVFRRLEQEVLSALLAGWEASGEAPVVALGGGTLLHRQTRLRALDTAIVVTLKASPEQLARRAQTGAKRPLLSGGDPVGRIRDLLEQRQFAYSEAHAQLDAERSPQQVAEEAREVWARDPIAVAAGADTYCVEIGAGLIGARLNSLLQGASATLLVTDDVVGDLHGDSVRASLSGLTPPLACVTLPSGEVHKNPETLGRLWQACFDHGLDRKSRIIALGGGVVTDMAGFAAATWMRGIGWVGVPTTLLAMVDASVGGKTAVDFRTAKNCVGAFWQPRGVLCDTTVLSTESPRAYTGALAEVVKTAVLGDPALLSLLESQSAAVRARDPDVIAEMISRSVRVKARVVSLDEREAGPRAMLNFGHTLGHALEALGNYETYTHGEAVSLGIVVALALGRQLGMTPPELQLRIVRLLQQLGLPTRVSAAMLRDASRLIVLDKKRAGADIRFVVAEQPGTVSVKKISLEHLHRLVAEVAAQLG